MSTPSFPWTHLIRVATAALLLLTASPVLGDAKPDVIYLVADGVTLISHHRLLANDEYSGDPSLSLIRPTTAGSLQPGDGHFTFDATDLEPGTTYSFSYLLRGSSVASSADVLLVVLPQRLPVAGRWPVEKPHPGEPCTLGDGGELGIYDAFHNRFRLCDFTGSGLRDCFYWPVEPSSTYSSEAINLLKLPLMADWDGDGIDEPGLYEPRNRKLETFEYSTDCRRGERCLTSTGFLAHGLSSRELPVILEDAGGQRLVGYDWALGHLTSPGESGMQIATSTPDPWPLVGDWRDRGEALLGAWDGSASLFHYLEDAAGQATGVLSAVGDNGRSITGVPFAVPSSACEPHRHFGLLHNNGETVGLFDLSFLDGHSRPPVHVKVPVDPPD